MVIATVVAGALPASFPALLQWISFLSEGQARRAFAEGRSGEMQQAISGSVQKEKRILSSPPGAVCMSHSVLRTSRRLFLSTLSLGAAAFTVPGLFAEELDRARTPRLTEGPFYPDKLPLDTDNDLLIVNDSITPAVGEITHLGGKVLDIKGNPIVNATIEIWQVDNKGVYLHSGDSSGRARDTNFQGFGRFTTGSTGEYYFRTIKPVPYPGRTPHIHVKVKKGGRELLTTQIFVNGHEQNRGDGVLADLRDPFDRQLVLVDFKPLQGSKLGELTARFDMVTGITPEDTPPERRR
jgi:protocatechuate 3,4-dioxygenase beta subunit